MGNGTRALANCQLISAFTEYLFERDERIRMRAAKVERFEGVGRGVMGLLRLWKCVKSRRRGPGDELRARSSSGSDVRSF